MPKQPDWEPVKLWRKQVTEGNAWMAFGITCFLLGAGDTIQGESQIDTEFARRYPTPITRQQSDANQARIDSMNEMIAQDALDGRLPDPQIRKTLLTYQDTKSKIEAQRKYKQSLRAYLNPDISQPKNRFLGDLLFMLVGTGLSITGAILKRESLMKLEDHERTNK